MGSEAAPREATPGRGQAALFGAFAGAVGALTWGFGLGLRLYDDAFITLHVASNWAAGLGPVFNAGERVEATTSPLWTALLAAAIRIGAAPQTATLVLGLAAAAAASAATAVLAWDLAGPVAAVSAALILQALPSWSAWPLTGMDAPLGGAMLALAALAALRCRTPGGAVLAGIACAGAALARPELAAVIPVLAAGAALASDSRERSLQRAVLVMAAAACVLGAHLLARHAFYGAWLPNTFVAKSGGGGWPLRVRGAEWLANALLLHAPVLLAAAFVARTSPAARIVALACVADAAGCAWAGGDHFPLGRLLAPALPLLAALAGGAVARVRRVALPATAGVIAAALAAQVYLPDRANPNGGEGVAGLAAFSSFGRDIVEVAWRVRDAQLPPGTLAAVSVGALACFGGHPVLDLVGLTDPHIARSPRLEGAATGHDHGDAGYVLSRRPEYVIFYLIPAYAPISDERERAFVASTTTQKAAALLLNHPEFAARYRPVQLLTRRGPLRLWARNDVADALATVSSIHRP